MRTVVVASGKGGTGKTTLAALFALRASRQARLVVADSDVEASNLPIALDVEVGVCEPFEGGLVARIDPKACIECGQCAVTCRFGAIARTWSDDMRSTYHVDRWTCEGCTACVAACLSNAITVERTVAGEACQGSGPTGPISFGQLGPGQDLSGKLVTEVRGTASAIAEASDAEILIIDGPPGIGCPVIAATTNTDLVVGVTEPSRSGEHDLRRLWDLTQQLGVQMVAVLNKSDLSEQGAEHVRALCCELSVELIAEIPFDEELSRILPALAARQGFDECSHGVAAVDAAWQEITYRLAEGA